MKKTLISILVISIFLSSAYAYACVGRVLNIGIVNSVSGNVFAQLISVLINERTGTTVNVSVYDNQSEIYDAVKKEEVAIVIENTDHALVMLDLEASGDKKKDYTVSKKAFRDRMSMIWLKPFGFLDEGSGQNYYSAVITEDVLVNFPALPRVINKLGGISRDKRFGSVIKAADSEGNLKRAARELLKKKKLI